MYPNPRTPTSSRLQFSRHNHIISSQISQEKQIEELEQKVDIILIHNNKLIEENNELRKLLQTRNVSSSASNYELIVLKKDIELKQAQMEDLKNALHEEIEVLTKELIGVKNQKEDLKDKIKKLEDELSQSELRNKKEIQDAIEQVRNEMYENALQKQSQYHKEMSEKESAHRKQISALIDEQQKKIELIEEEKREKIYKMEEKFRMQSEEKKKSLEADFEKRVRQIEKSTNERCRKVRQNSETYIKTMLETQKEDVEESEDALKKQIDSLRNSLKTRQVLIEELLRNENKNRETDYNRYYKEAQQLRDRIKEITEHFFKESELLKIKMAIKHEADVREVSKAYESRIDVLGQKLNYYEIQNERLRQRYEEQIRSKMGQRKNFEIETSRLKVVIRKLKVEVSNCGGKQFRLNIDGENNQPNSFSVSMIASEQDKVKHAFYEEETRKLKQIIQLKEDELQTTIEQCESKIKFYSEKLQSYQQRLQEEQANYSEQEERHTRELDSQKSAYLREIEQNNDHFQKEIEHLEDAIKQQRQKTAEVEEKLIEANSSISILKKDIKDKDHDIQSLKAHVETIKLQMQMMGSEYDPETIIRPLKDQYQRIIDGMKKDKENLQSTNSIQADQMAKLVAKYKALQVSMQKTISTLHKRRELDEKVMNLGMDENLVKNLAQIFHKSEQ